MAESIVQVTEGAGKKLHTFQRTIGANSVEDEVIIQGENYLASYTIAAGPLVVATANSHLLQIMAGASLKVRVRRIEMWQQAAFTTGAFYDFALIRLSSAGTGGGVVASTPLDPADAASGFTYMTLPTAKGTEAGGFIFRVHPYVMQTVGASTADPGPMVVFDFDRPRSKPLIIAAGATNGLAVKNVASAAAGAVTINVVLDESNF